MNMETFKTTAGQINAELQRRGINASVPVTVVINPISELFWEARESARAAVKASGLTDDELDALIKQARAEIAAEDK
jgi:hypothetical protein